MDAAPRFKFLSLQLVSEPTSTDQPYPHLLDLQSLRLSPQQPIHWRKVLWRNLCKMFLELTFCVFPRLQQMRFTHARFLQLRLSATSENTLWKRFLTSSNLQALSTEAVRIEQKLSSIYEVCRTSNFLLITHKDSIIKQKITSYSS